MSHALRFTLLLAVLLALPGASALAQESQVNLAAEGRRAAEVARDETSKPIAVFDWIGVDEDDAVADIYAGDGYNTWVLSQWVGADGIVFSQSSYKPDTLMARISSGDLAAAGNVVYLATLKDLPTDSLDLVFTDRNYHDFPPERVGEILGEIRRALKPGGTFAVIDARAVEGRDTEAHRIADAVIIAEVTAAGFELEGQSEMLANPEDDHVGGKWDQRDALDRSLLKFEANDEEDD